MSKERDYLYFEEPLLHFWEQVTRMSQVECQEKYGWIKDRFVRPIMQKRFLNQLYGRKLISARYFHQCANVDREALIASLWPERKIANVHGWIVWCSYENPIGFRFTGMARQPFSSLFVDVEGDAAAGFGPPHGRKVLFFTQLGELLLLQPPNEKN